MGQSVDDPRDTHEASTLRCPRCAQRLNELSGVDDLRFLCDNGHEVDSEELLSAHTISVLAELQEMLYAWERRVAQLKVTVESARRRGHVDVAALYDRQLDAARRRVHSIREALAKARL